jgi:pyruvate kinase
MSAESSILVHDPVKLAAGQKDCTETPHAPMARTKIVATVGPACRQPDQLADLIRAGVDVFRVNMAHAGWQKQQEVVQTIRSVAASLKAPTAILVDLAGPKIRLGELPGGERAFALDEVVEFIRGTKSDDPNKLVVTYEPLVDELDPGDRVMLSDGTVGMVVLDKSANSVRCRVTQPGSVLSKQGVNLPGAKLSVPAMSEVDRENAIWAARAGIDYVSLSFVRHATEVHELKQMIKSQHSLARVISKIEKQEALDHLDEIIDATDGVMVARGDLGVEIDVARTPVEQKRIITACNRRYKPVIVATQMLDSMRHSRTPTRAEVTDVANAILDGADACMLSGETAIGDHPVEAVNMMHRISIATEPLLKGRQVKPMADQPIEGLHRVTEAVVYGMGQIAEMLDAKLLVAATHSGATALALSKQRRDIPVLGVTDNEMVLRQMNLFWGVTPIAGAPAHNLEDLIRHVEAWGTREGKLKKGDHIVIVSAISLVAKGHNLLAVHEVR